MRPGKAMLKAFSAGFQRFVQRCRPFPVGSRLMIARDTHLRAAVSVGKCPRALTALRILALTLSIALVVYIIVRISLSKDKNGTNSAQAFSHNWTIAGYWASHRPENSAKRSNAAASVGAV